MSPPADYRASAASFRRSPRASNKSPRTVETYREAVDQLGEWLADHDDAPATTGELKRAHIEAFLIHLFDDGKSAATLNNRYRSLHRLFTFVVEEGEAVRHPMERMTPPQVPEQPVDVLTEGQVRALLDDFKGRAFKAIRNTAIIHLMIDTGIRRAELLGMVLDDVDLDQDLIFLLGKGRRKRACRSAARPRWHWSATSVTRRSCGTPPPPIVVAVNLRRAASGLATKHRRRGDRIGMDPSTRTSSAGEWRGRG